MCVISVLLNLLRLSLWPNVVYPKEENAHILLCAFEKDVCILLLLDGVLYRCQLGLVSI